MWWHIIIHSLSIAEIGALKSSIIIVLESITPFMSTNACYIYLSDLMWEHVYLQLFLVAELTTVP
jgi:hypothetical protein